MRDYLYSDRTKLAVYSLATFGLALHTKQNERRQSSRWSCATSSQYVVEDDENQTAYLNLPGGYLVVLVRQRVRGPRLLPEAARGDRAQERSRPAAGEVPGQQPQARHLLEQHARHGPGDRSVRRLHQGQRRGQAEPHVEVWVDGEKRKEVEINAENLFTFDNAFVLEGDGLAAGEHTVELRKTGTGPLYWNGYLTNSRWKTTSAAPASS